ncbi:MAG TPA: hypothetical protein GX692_04550 [Acholeplasmataceae bacterium]|nr:hypothetical protein [Acholeplasmataceae bacterium]
MKNKNKNSQAELHNHYKLKSKAVDELVEALKQEPNAEVKTDSPKPPQDPYKIDRLAKIPTFVKALFAKYWVAGAICYFGLWGLGLFLSDLDAVLFLGLFTGVITDLFVNTAFLYFESDKKEFHKYMMLPVASKKLWTLFVNVIYGILVTIAVAQIYIQINIIAIKVKDLPKGTITLGVEPLLYGLFFLLVDMFFISIKNLIVMIIKRRNEKATSGP